MRMCVCVSLAVCMCACVYVCMCVLGVWGRGIEVSEGV